MSKSKIFLASNLKFLRNRRKKSQKGTAESLKITRSKLASYEGGAVKNPPMEDLLKLSEYFKMAIDTLLRVDLSKLSELKLRELEMGSDIYVRGSHLRVLATTIDKNNKENIEFVTIKAKAGYTSGFHDPEYIGKLPTFSLPMLKQDIKYRVFPVEGDSMLPFPENAFMIGEYIDDWFSIKNGERCLIITKNEGFVLKEVHNKIKKNRSLLLTSLNKIYHPFEIAMSEILEIWKFKGYIDLKWPDPVFPSISSLLDKVEDLKGELVKIRG